jgi:diguanylate cyclase (GGDEF)-like protein
MERRTSQRTMTDQAVVLVVRGMSLWNWRIGNFSAGGLFLEPRDGLALPGGTKGLPDEIRVEIPPEVSGKPAVLSAQVKIRFRGEAGLGVSFTDPGNEILKYLVAKHREERQRDRKSLAKALFLGSDGKDQAQEILKGIASIGERFLQQAYEQYEHQSVNALAHFAEEAESNDQREDLMLVSETLVKEWSGIRQRFFSSFRVAMAALMGGVKSGGAAKRPEHGDEVLELVSRENFDEWALVVGIARRAGADLSRQLFILEKCLLVLSRTRVSDETNPLSPYSILWDYKQALEPLGLSFPAKQILFKLFHQHVLSRIATLYDELRAFLDERGVVDRVRAAGLIDHISVRDEERERSAPRVRSKKTAMGTLASLLGTRNAGTGRATGVTGTGAAEAGAQAATISEQAALEVLAAIPVVGLQPVTEQIESRLNATRGADGPVVLTPQVRGVITATEQLVSSIQADLHLNREIRRFVASLQVPLIREALSDPTLLNNPEHPGRRLLEALGYLAPYLSPASDPVSGEKGLLGGVLDSIGVGDLQSGSVDLNEITARIEQLIQQQKVGFDENRAVVVKSCDEDQTYRHAEGMVLELLKRKLATGTVSVLLERLLRLGWAGLLTQTLATRGAQCEEWRTYSGLVDRFLELFAETQPPLPVPRKKIAALIEVLKDGFTRYPVHREASAQFIADLEKLLRQESDQYGEFLEQRVSLDRDTLDSMFRRQVAGVPAKTGGDQAGSDWLELVHGISIGEWIVEQREAGQVRLISLAWKNASASRLVFVDGSGRKALDTGDTALAMLFSERKYAMLEDNELPLVSRTVNRILQDTLRELKQESDRDRLTGLHSRKALERKLQQLIGKATEGEIHHILMMLDIDRFSMINDACGFEGGDKLLVTAAGLLGAYQTREAFLARTGDDEFAILIENCTLDEGFQIAEIQRRALENLKFSWNDVSVPVTVSIGIVAIDHTTPYSEPLLQAAASASSLTKQEGGNATRIYQKTDHDIERRNRMVRAVPIIEDALKKNRLAIFTQLIRPVFLGEGEPTCHELLLRVVDDKNRFCEPEEFIQAAEYYNRMRSVDRWVVDHFFSWLEHHHEQLSGEDDFSVNLSVQSLTDTGFADFLLAKVDASPFPSAQLAFEVTETALAQPLDKVVQLLTELRLRGCRIFLDDFGSGYASYSSLKDLPVDVIKIDGTFVKDMLTDKSSYAMVKSVTEIAHFLNKKVVAEYVESEGILIALQELEVDFVQGFAVGKPAAIQNVLRPEVA